MHLNLISDVLECSSGHYCHGKKKRVFASVIDKNVLNCWKSRWLTVQHRLLSASDNNTSLQDKNPLLFASACARKRRCLLDEHQHVESQQTTNKRDEHAKSRLGLSSRAATLGGVKMKCSFLFTTVCLKCALPCS